VDGARFTRRRRPSPAVIVSTRCGRKKVWRPDNHFDPAELSTRRGQAAEPAAGLDGTADQQFCGSVWAARKGRGNGLISLRTVGSARYDSIMCSIEQRVAEIGRAIDELASAENAAAATDTEDSGRILARLAELWALLADLDPEVAKRLPGYQALLSPADAANAA
jgi:hypothetical protein